MRENTSTYLVASLASTFIPPRVARLLALATIVILVGLLTWIPHSDTMAIGLVTEVLPPGVLPDTLVKAQGIPFIDTVHVLRIPAALALQASPRTHDLVFAIGTPDPRSASLLDGTLVQMLPLTDVISMVTQAIGTVHLTSVNPIGIYLAAAVILLFWRQLLRLTVAALMASILGLAAFIAATINLQVYVLPIPATYVPTLTVAAAAIGSVIGYKSMTRPRPAWLERLAALALSLPLIIATAHLLPQIPAPLFLLAALSAVLLPASMPALAAYDLVLEFLHPGSNQAAGVLVAILGLLAVIAFIEGRRPRFAQSPIFAIRPDARGEVSLEQILDDGRGA